MQQLAPVHLTITVRPDLAAMSSRRQQIDALAVAAYAFAVMGDVFDGDQLIGHMDYLIDCKINPKPNIQRKAQLIVAMIKTIKPSTTVAILAAPFL